MKSRSTIDKQTARGGSFWRLTDTCLPSESMRRHASVLLVSLLLIAGCEDSTTPLSDPATARLDERLIGIWRYQAFSGGVMYYHVGRLGGKAPKGVMRVVAVAHHDDGELEEPSQMLAFCSDIGGNSYLNAAPVTQEQLGLIRGKGWEDDRLHSYMLFKYRLDGDALLLRTMDLNAKRRAVEDEKLEGEIDLGTIAPRIKFTDTTKNVAQFVATAGEELFSDMPPFFDKPVRLERVQ